MLFLQEKVSKILENKRLYKIMRVLYKYKYAITFKMDNMGRYGCICV